ncbi:hypothetical protein E4U09_001483 [Claviceps aff. purpurea]|uniref:Uncharacterized protein n=1 Tax=Claviceps aff. purpurea TaxID=1967640 RepID=A0A9P7QJW7_9HYPO|nr:hypothetical protein E4U09_001483 [Claviceps aff. purpurea]
MRPLGLKPTAMAWGSQREHRSLDHPSGLSSGPHPVLSRRRSAAAIGVSSTRTAPSTATSRMPPHQQHQQHHKQLHTQHQHHNQHHRPPHTHLQQLHHEQHRKHHAPSARALNMPVADRPRQPQLSAAAAKAVHRAPLTPKIATKGPQSPLPLAKRPPSSTPVLVPATVSVTREDSCSTTPANGLVINSAPRAGSRQIRVNSAGSTPSGSPKPDKTSDDADSNRTGLAATSNESSKFFYASEVKVAQPAPSPRPVSMPQKPANTFLYANGATADGGRNSGPPSSSTSISTTTQNLESTPSSSAKFFFANGVPETSSRPGIGASVSASALPSTSRLAPPRSIASNLHVGPGGSAQRPTSPTKPAAAASMAQTLRSNAASPTSPRQTSLISSSTSLQQQQQQQQDPSSSSAAARRKVSIDSAPRVMGRPKRTGSPTAMEPLTLGRFALSPNNMSESTLQSPPLSPGLSKTGMTMASILQAAEDLKDDADSKDGDVQSELHSPTVASSAQLQDSVTELVANARRERKVQDLEITNASLEAINRTLERQLRKQTAELRRYRRLSRSVALTASSSRVTSMALSEPPTDVSDVEEGDETKFGEDGDDADEDKDEEEEEDEDTDSPYGSDHSSNVSMSTEDILLQGAKFEARRRRDEKRLQLDLTKHQELLVDSQKMNQSLKRCLDFTEALIKEGQKALEYRVRVSDIKLGGRILAPPDEDDEDVSFMADEGQGEGGGEGGTGEETGLIRVDDAAGLGPPWVKGGQDRDSGIELPPEGS